MDDCVPLRSLENGGSRAVHETHMHMCAHHTHFTDAVCHGASSAGAKRLPHTQQTQGRFLTAAKCNKMFWSNPQYRRRMPNALRPTPYAIIPKGGKSP